MIFSSLLLLVSIHVVYGAPSPQALFNVDRPSVISIQSLLCDGERNQEFSSFPFNQLPFDCQDIIISQLSLLDCFNLGLTCRNYYYWFKSETAVKRYNRVFKDKDLLSFELMTNPVCNIDIVRSVLNRSFTVIDKTAGDIVSTLTFPSESSVSGSLMIQDLLQKGRYLTAARIVLSKCLVTSADPAVFWKLCTLADQKPFLFEKLKVLSKFCSLRNPDTNFFPLIEELSPSAVQRICLIVYGKRNYNSAKERLAAAFGYDMFDSVENFKSNVVPLIIYHCKSTQQTALYRLAKLSAYCGTLSFIDVILEQLSIHRPHWIVQFLPIIYCFALRGGHVSIMERLRLSYSQNLQVPIVQAYIFETLRKYFTLRHYKKETHRSIVNHLVSLSRQSYIHSFSCQLMERVWYAAHHTFAVDENWLNYETLDPAQLIRCPPVLFSQFAVKARHQMMRLFTEEHNAASHWLLSVLVCHKWPIHMASLPGLMKITSYDGVIRFLVQEKLDLNRTTWLWNTARHHNSISGPQSLLLLLDKVMDSSNRFDIQATVNLDHVCVAFAMACIIGRLDAVRILAPMLPERYVTKSLMSDIMTLPHSNELNTEILYLL